MTKEISRSKLESLLIKIKKVFKLNNLTPLCELSLNLTPSGNSDDPGDVLFNILQRVLEQDENTDLRNFYRQQILK